MTLSSFYLGKYQVTQAEYLAVMGFNPAYAYGVGDNYPVYYVTWSSALKYCNLRSMNEGLTPVYSISGSTNPADWGATNDPDFLYSGSDDLSAVGWHTGNNTPLWLKTSWN